MHEDDWDGDIHEQPVCPICEATDGLCGHLLAQIDVTQGEMLGGKFFRHEGQVFEALNDAVTGSVESIKGKRDGVLLTRIGMPRLATLAEAAREEIGDSVDAEGVGMCYDDFLDYLDDLYRDLPGVVATQHDLAGDPGQSSLCESYWCEDAVACVEVALRRIEEDAEALRRLTG